MQQDTHYDDVVGEVRSFLAQRCDLLRAAGVAPARIVLDPGIGFGKSVADNFALLPGQGALRGLGFPVLAGWSRKSAIGSVTGRATEERMVGSVAAALAAVQYGARVIRVHDVAATVDALPQRPDLASRILQSIKPAMGVSQPMRRPDRTGPYPPGGPFRGAVRRIPAS
jgi:dihydropteroate synthase